MNRLYNIIIFILFFTNILSSNVVASDKNSIKLLNMINHQTMLSQQITKAYLYAGNKIAIDDANKEIKSSLREFKSCYYKINSLTTDKKVKRVINSVKNSTNQFIILSQKPLNTKNAKLMLNLSESILKKSERVISLLKKDINSNDSEFIALLGQQGMLAQRIAKYYIAYQSDKSKKTKRNMENSIKLFAKNHKKLMKYRKSTNPKIAKKLKEIDRLWKIVHQFYTNIERGKLPLIVFETTDNITNQMNELIKIYTAQIK